MDSSTAQALADFAALVSILTFILGVVVLIVFFVMASNIGSMTRSIRRMETQQMEMVSSLHKIAGMESEAEKAKRFDSAIEAAKNREHSKI